MISQLKGNKMERYFRNDKKAKKLAGPVKRAHLRWKIGIWILLILVLGLAGGLTYAVFWGEINAGNDSVLDLVLILQAIAFLPICVIISVAVVATSGGRYVFHARLEEKVYMEPMQLRNTFMSKYNNTSARLAEVIIPYEWIRDMFWNAEFHRLEIVTDYRYLVHFSNYIDEKVVTDKKAMFYNYFDGMEQMIYSLEQRTGKAVRWKYYDQVKPEAQ